MAMDPDRLAFVKAIAACPEDDTLRLVYADWLQERGEDDRAEVIRARIAYNNEVIQTGKRYNDNRYFERTGMAQYWFWSRIFPQKYEGLNGSLDRGMLKLIRCPWDWWAHNGDRLTDTEWVPLVRLTTAPELRRSTKQRYDPALRAQIITEKVVGAGKVAQCEHAISELELKAARDGNHLYAMATLKFDEALAPKRVLELWWPLTKFEGAGLEE